MLQMENQPHSLQRVMEDDTLVSYEVEACLEETWQISRNFSET